MERETTKKVEYLQQYMNLLWKSGKDSTGDDSGDTNVEYEVRFGTRRDFRKITKTNYDNVVKYLKSIGFVFGTDTSTLKMNAEYIDKRTGKMRTSNIRTEIAGVHAIQDFCNTNSITDDSDKVKRNIQFIQKSPYTIKDDATGVSTIARHGDYDDFSFRVSLSNEKTMSPTSGLIRQLTTSWNDKKKIYRFVTRTRAVHSKYPGVAIDMSVVKSSKKNEKHRIIPTYNVKDSNVFNESEHYEIEIEYDNETTKLSSNPTIATSNVKACITHVLRGLQQTNFPVSYTEMDGVLQSYMKLIHGKDEEYRVYPKHFIGPSSISLELKNVGPLSDDSNVPNIRQPYTVTDKADGIRKLLYIARSGKIYMIDTNMNVQFTGLRTKSVAHINSIIDGEHITVDKDDRYINVYAAFDVYFIGGEDKRTKAFVPESEVMEHSNYRLPLLQKFVETLETESSSGAKNLAISVKTFYVSDGTDETMPIFHWCKKILDDEKEDNGMYNYEMDGLIFTPAYRGVGMSGTEGEAANVKRTWNASFKWKPPQFNTIDFLVTTVKDGAADKVGVIHQEGVDMSSVDQLKHFKTLQLRVGFDESKHGYINPCNDVYEDNVPVFNAEETRDTYKPLQFYPTSPNDANAGVCNIMTSYDPMSNQHIMYTEDQSEAFGDNTIVEFKYDKTQKEFWKWTPIRVRHDKTSELRRGLKNYGNAYHVANSVWRSIHHPVTEEMITTGTGIPEISDDENVYYDRSGTSNTRALRDFHNLYVKRKLITSVSNRGDTLIDLAVGKAGDLSKWIAAKLKFVFGVDVSSDNINNRLDGACARYLNKRKQYKSMPKALFVVGDSGLPLKTGEALTTEKSKEITQAVFGVGPKDRKQLGEGVYKQYGVGREGFNVVSCQFAFHYFFRSRETLRNFLRNVADTCALNGYFIGTCYDGKSIFKLLDDKKQGESISNYVDGRKMWEIKKMYDSVEFNDNESSLGYAIDVYQESINKTFREYLVNFDYVIALMQQYGFELITDDEARSMNLPQASGTFESLYKNMKLEVEKEKKSRKKHKLVDEIGTALDLEESAEQSQVSFLNRYFIFKKVAQVDGSIVDVSAPVDAMEEKAEEVESEKIEKVAEEAIKKTKKPRRTKLKLRLKKTT